MLRNSTVGNKIGNVQLSTYGQNITIEPKSYLSIDNEGNLYLADSLYLTQELNMVFKLQNGDEVRFVKIKQNQQLIFLVY